MDDHEFRFHPPLYVLGARDDFKGDPGRWQIRFVSRTSDGISAALVFSNEARAEEFLASLPASDLSAETLPTQDAFCEFLRTVLKNRYRHLMIDPNPTTRLGQVLTAKPLLDQLEGERSG